MDSRLEPKNLRDAQVNEGQDAVFTVSSSVPVARDTDVEYVTVLKGAGITTEDYALNPNVGDFTIPAGQTSGAVTLHAVQDSIQEGNENVGLKLVRRAGYKLGTPKKVTVTIINVP